MKKVGEGKVGSYEFEFHSVDELIDYELFIMTSMNFNLNVPVSLKFFERYAHCAFVLCESDLEKQENFNLGLYLLHLAAFYPSVQFTYPQSMIAASALHLVFRIRKRNEST